MTRQIPFDLPVRAAHGRDDFLIAPSNADALAALDDWPHWPSGRLVLVGPEGAGKTHLAQVWAAAAGARVAGPAALADAALPALAAGPLALDGAEGVAGDAAGERALFHLVNLMQAGGHPLLLTARTPPRDWGLRLPDLASRLAAAGLARIAPPDDALLAAVMVKLFADRQVTVAPSVILWLVPRMHRSLAFAGRLVAALDAAALAEGRPIGPRLAAQVLAGLADEGQ